jgi:hypothetical protein
MKFTRVWAMPNKETFTIKPIKELLERYVGDGQRWIDPFAGDNSPAEYTNDIHPERKTKWHMDAKDFCKKLPPFPQFNGVLFDPPYSNRQISEHYKEVGKKANGMDTSASFYTSVMEELKDKIKTGGYVISFGWNSGGFGKGRGFEIIEILLVPHGGHHNDTIVTVEQKTQGQIT